MLKLNLSRAPFWLDLAQGVRVEVEPIGSTIFAGASVDASGAGNLGAQNVRFVKAVARRAIRAWEGVGDEGGAPLPVTDEAVDALMEQSVECLRAFREGYVNRVDGLVTEGNGSPPSLGGTTAGAPDTAASAKPAAKPARRSRTAR